MGCDGPTGHCELSREAGGYGCPIPICLPPGKYTLKLHNLLFMTQEKTDLNTL